MPGDETHRTLARGLVAAVKRNVTIDRTMRENMRAQLRVYVKHILRRYGYPPDKREKATQTVLEQAKVRSEAGAYRQKSRSTARTSAGRLTSLIAPREEVA